MLMVRRRLLFDETRQSEWLGKRIDLRRCFLFLVGCFLYLLYIYFLNWSNLLREFENGYQMVKKNNDETGKQIEDGRDTNSNLAMEDNVAKEADEQTDMSFENPSLIENIQMSTLSQRMECMSSRFHSRDDTLPPRQNNLLEGVARGKKILIFSLTGCKSTQNLEMATKSFLKHLDKNIFSFIAFFPRCNSKEPIYNVNRINLEVDDEYPPQKFEFAAWKYLADHMEIFLDIAYFMKVDSDTYVNTYQLSKSLSFLPDPDKYSYIGIEAMGEEKEIGKLGLKEPYCLGMGYILSKSVVQQMKHFISLCVNNIASLHSDTEVGRCLYIHLSLSCKNIFTEIQHNGINFLQLYISFEGWQKGDFSLSANPIEFNEFHQQNVKFPLFPPQTFFDAILVHPIKNPVDMERLNWQVMNNMRSLIPKVVCSHKLKKGLCTLATQMYHRSCTNNPRVQQSLVKLRKKKCNEVMQLPTPDNQYYTVGIMPDQKTLIVSKLILDNTNDASSESALGSGEIRDLFKTCQECLTNRQSIRILMVRGDYSPFSGAKTICKCMDYDIELPLIESSLIFAIVNEKNLKIAQDWIACYNDPVKSIKVMLDEIAILGASIQAGVISTTSA